MLPGFRFLFTAIVLSMSILVFGLGAAALLRAAHEEFASMPSRRAPPEPVFAQQSEPPASTLALLRVDPPVAEKAADNVAAAGAPAEQAQRARERRHSARRTRVARPAVAAQPPADPFAQPAVARASR